jgi:hypothetical protein
VLVPPAPEEEEGAETTAATPAEAPVDPDAG